MAILETRSIQVKNDSDTINRTNEEWGQFGWNVLSVQVTHSQNTKTYSSAWDQLGGNESQTVETTTINYATITYQRDKGMANYKKIVELEKQYQAISAEITELNEKKEGFVNYLVLIIVAIVFWPAAIAYLAYIIYVKKKEHDNWNKAYDLRAQLPSIAEQAATLL